MDGDAAVGSDGDARGEGQDVDDDDGLDGVEEAGETALAPVDVDDGHEPQYPCWIPSSVTFSRNRAPSALLLS